jgi:Xaa-Pro aminopeptidase
MDVQVNLHVFPSSLYFIKLSATTDSKWQNKTMSKDAAKKLAERGSARSHRPTGAKFVKYIGSNWSTDSKSLPKQSKVAPFAAIRRDAVAQAFQGKIIVIDAGPELARSNDTYYRYRPHSAFAHLTGWGAETVPDSVLVIDARGKKQKSVLYFRETAGKNTDEFFANSQIGEFWVGSRPNLKQVAALLGIQTKSLKKLETDLSEHKKKHILTLAKSTKLVEFVSELRLIKDSYEIAEMKKSVAASIKGFEAVVKNLNSATKHPRGERIVESAFFAEARAEGNDLGYETIAAAGEHACTLHWIVNNGPVKPGELLLLDAGVEVDSLYTADVTRTLPINGKFSKIQKEIYLAVLEAADAVFAMAKPGVTYSEMHKTAMKVIAQKTAEWGFYKGGYEESLKPENQWHRRWMIHGTGHHLGLDVHDCAQARREMYHDHVLEEGMIFTIEPGLYFHKDDLMVPKEFRGIGVRIEDDVLVTKTGVQNLTGKLPRKPEEIEAWMAKLRA